MSNKKSLVMIYDRKDVGRLITFIKNLQKKEKEFLIISLNTLVTEVLQDHNIQHKTNLDYLKPNKFMITEKGRKWLKNVFESNKTLKRAIKIDKFSLIEIDEAGIFLSHNIETVLEYTNLISRIIKVERPSNIFIPDNYSIPGKSIIAVANHYKIPVHMICSNLSSILKNIFKRHFATRIVKYLRNFRDFERKITAKKDSIGKGRKKILTLVYDVNQVKTLKPIVEELKRRGKYELAVVKSDSSISERTKNMLERLEIPYKTFEGYVNDRINEVHKKYEEKLSMIWNKLKRSRKFKNSIKYNGISVYYPLEGMFESLFRTKSHLAFIAKVTAVIKNILKTEKPDMVIIFGEVSSLRRAMAKYCKEYKIPTMFLQHGIFGKDQIFDLDIGDKMAVNGQFTKDILVYKKSNSKEIIVTGQPRYDILVKKTYNDKKIIKNLNLNPIKKHILLTTQPMGFRVESREALLRGVLKTIKNLPGKELIIKLHPMEENGSKIYRDILEDEKSRAKIVTDKEIVSHGYDFFDLMHACDLLITGFSTTVPEAMALDKPVIVINFTNKPDQMPYVESGAAIGVYKPEDIAHVIEKVFKDKKLRKCLEEKMKKFVRYHLYKIDGLASSRVVDLIENIVEK